MVQATLGQRRTKPSLPKKRRWWVWGVLALCTATLALWFAYGTSRTFDTQGPDFVIKRLAVEQGPLWGAPAPPAFVPAAANVCNTRARAALAKVSGASPPQELANLLVIDPDCVPAMRLLVQATASQGRLTEAHGRLVGRAEREPFNAAAQVGAAIFSDYAGRSGDMLAFLQRAQALRSDTVGLSATWADYYRLHVQPAQPQKAWQSWMEELKRGEDPRTLAHVIGFLAQVPDRFATLAMCERFYRAVPQHTGESTARTCLKAATELDDAEGIAAYAARLGSRGEGGGCQQRWVTYFRFIAGQPQARVQAAQADASCPQLFGWLRAAALLAQGRTAVAAAALGGVTDAPAWMAAAVLAAGGQRDAALARLPEPLADESASARLHALLALDLIGPAGLIALVQPPAPATRGAHLAQAACGYATLAFETQAEQNLAQAVSASPDDPFVTACQLRWFAGHHDATRAEAVIERATQLHITHPIYTAELAHFRARQNKCEQALPLLQTAQMKLPLEPTLHEDLMHCLRRTNRTEEAERWATLLSAPNETWPWLAAAAVVALLLGGTLWWVKKRAARAAIVR